MQSHLSYLSKAHDTSFFLRVLLCSMTLLASISWTPQHSFAQVQGESEWDVIVNSADVYAGPSKAYSVRGRAYLGQKLRVIGVSPKQDWLQVITPDGKKGWVTAETLRNPRREVSQDPGRFRRQTEYQYDAQGRRITPNGEHVGSGEGFGQSPSGGMPPTQGMMPTQGVMPTQGMASTPMMGVDQAVPPGFGGTPQKTGGLSISVIPAGLSRTSRRFTSDIKKISPLAQTESEALLYQYGLIVNYGLNDHFIFQLKGTDARGAEITLPPHPEQPDFVPTTQVGTSMSVMDLSVSAGLPVGKLWFGGNLGAQYLMHQFDEIAFALPELKGFTPLQSHHYFSLAAGLSIRLMLNSFQATLNGGLLLPILLSASPYEIGPWEGFGYSGDLHFAYLLNDTMGVGLYLGGQYLGVDVSATGAYSDRTYIFNAQNQAVNNPQIYKRASTSDQALNGGLFFQLSL